MKKTIYSTLILAALVLTSCASNPSQTIIFDANGGEGSIKNQVISLEEAQTIAKNSFTKDGYAFLGWDINDDGIFDFSDEQVYSIVPDLATTTLKAVWVPEENSKTK